MSENITHTAILEDCFNMMFASEQICKPFKEVGKEHVLFAQFGSVTRSGDRFTVQLLDNYRTDWEERRKKEKLDFKLAFVLGWLCHRAADRQMKPVFRQHEPESNEFPTDCSIYHDAFIFNEYYLKEDKKSPFRYPMATFEKDMESLPASSHIKVHDVTELFRVISQRILIEMHTFIPDRDDIEGWFEKLYEKHQEQIIQMERYAEAIMEPDPVKVKRFIEEPHFYSDEDPIIQLAKKLRNGIAVTQDEIESSVQSEAKSHYGQALQLGFNYLHSASAFFVGEIDQETLKDRLDVGKLGRDGLSV